MPNNRPFTPSTPLMARSRRKKFPSKQRTLFHPREPSGGVFFSCGISDLMEIDGGMLAVIYTVFPGVPQGSDYVLVINYNFLTLKSVLARLEVSNYVIFIHLLSSARGELKSKGELGSEFEFIEVYIILYRIYLYLSLFQQLSTVHYRFITLNFHLLFIRLSFISTCVCSAHSCCRIFSLCVLAFFVLHESSAMDTVSHTC